jgi:shikimate dehydrogenase
VTGRPAAAWVPRGTTRVAAVIGDPVRHSLSPAIHNAAFRALGLDWIYVALVVPDAALPAALAGTRALGLGGLSVTMPHKAAVAAAVDRRTTDVDALGAANTVVVDGGDLVGHNTDGPGFLDALRRDEGFDPAGRRCVVVGAGGAARAVVRALAAAGAADVAVVNRNAERRHRAVALAGPVGRGGTVEDADGADLVVNATPIGMGPVIAGPGGEVPLPVPAERLGAGQLVIDLVYDPPLTPFLVAARNRGAAVANGVGMLVHQAAHAFRLWTALEPPLEVMSAAATAALAPLAGGTVARSR